MAEFTDYYEILQVSPMAEAEVIDAAYKKLAQKYHPDVNNSPESTSRMKLLNIAYSVLGDRDKRKLYHAAWINAKTINTDSTKSRSGVKPNNGTHQFLIECRLWDEAKEYARTTIFETAKKFRVAGGTNFSGFKGHPRNRALPPHTVLYGTATTNNIERVATVVDDIACKYTLVPFRMNEDIINLHNRAICFTITPSRLLDELRWELARELNNFCDSKPYDLERDFVFHVTIANEHDITKIRRILSYLGTKKLRTFDLHVTRLTILEDPKDEIMWEYDLIFHRWLNRDQAIDSRLWSETVRRAKELQGLESVSQ